MGAALHRIRQIDELDLETVTVCNPLAQSPNSEPLGGVVAGGACVDPLLRVIADDALCGVYSDDGVEGRRHRLGVLAFGCARDDCHRFDHPPVAVEDLGLSIGGVANRSEELLGVHRFGEDPADAGRGPLVFGEWLEFGQTESAPELSRVAEFHVSVEGQVVRDQRHPVGEEQPHPLAERTHQSRRFGAVPQHAVVDDDRIRVTVGGAGEERARRRHGGDDLLDVDGSLDLETVGTVVPNRFRLEEVVEIGHELKEIHE